MQDAGSASSAFGRIRSFDSILEDIDQPPGDVKPQAKKEPPKKKNKPAPKTKAAPKTKKLPKEAAPEAAPEAAAEAAPEAAPKKMPQKVYKTTPQQRAYSSAFHKEILRQKRLGISKESARLEARVVGRAAREAVVKTAAAAPAAP